MVVSISLFWNQLNHWTTKAFFRGWFLGPLQVGFPFGGDRSSSDLLKERKINHNRHQEKLNVSIFIWVFRRCVNRNLTISILSSRPDRLINSKNKMQSWNFSGDVYVIFFFFFLQHPLWQPFRLTFLRHNTVLLRKMFSLNQLCSACRRGGNLQSNLCLRRGFCLVGGLCWNQMFFGEEAVITSCETGNIYEFCSCVSLLWW